MCRNNGPGSLTKINKPTTKGACIPILLLLRDLSSLVGPVAASFTPSDVDDEGVWAAGEVADRMSTAENSSADTVSVIFMLI